MRPFPINEINKYHAVKKLTCAEYGALIKIVTEYWETGELLRESDLKTASMLNTTSPLWRRMKSTVMNAIAKLMPELERLYIKKEQRLKNQRTKAKQAREVLERINSARKKEKIEKGLLMAEKADTQVNIRLPKTTSSQPPAWQAAQRVAKPTPPSGGFTEN